ncbi:MAG: ATP-binding protein, partial [Bacteroidota bacterium]
QFLNFMIERTISDKLRQLVTKFPVVSLTGPRQSGKTTLLRNLFPDYTYVNLELPPVRQAAKESPQAFLRQGNPGMIIDEAQHVPELFSYIQVEADEHQQNGRFLLCGSQHFLMMENISQSLAGRVAILQLLPFSFTELAAHEPWQPEDYRSPIFQGFFPRLYDHDIAPADFYPSYIQTYLERDARQVVNLLNLNRFQTFVQLCAGRIGQLFNQSEVGNEAGIDQKTARAWLSILETGFQVFTLRPYHRNFNKRIVKTPKIYFWDTGLACSLLGIQSPQDLLTHYARGALFENFVIAEMLKQYHHRGMRPNAYFWRDHTGNEVDLLFDQGGQLYPIEIKSSQSLNPNFFRNLQKFHQISGTPLSQSYLVYGGDQRLDDDNGNLRGWRHVPELYL